jgi:hypothetical protein
MPVKLLDNKELLAIVENNYILSGIRKGPVSLRDIYFGNKLVTISLRLQNKGYKIAAVLSGACLLNTAALLYGNTY